MEFDYEKPTAKSPPPGPPNKFGLASPEPPDDKYRNKKKMKFGPTKFRPWLDNRIKRDK